MRWGRHLPCKKGDTRVVEMFLWLPINLRVGATSKREWRWLEKATIQQVCTVNFDGLSAWLEWENQYFVERAEDEIP